MALQGQEGNFGEKDKLMMTSDTSFFREESHE